MKSIVHGHTCREVPTMGSEGPGQQSPNPHRVILISHWHDGGAAIWVSFFGGWGIKCCITNTHFPPYCIVLRFCILAEIGSDGNFKGIMELCFSKTIYVHRDV